MTARLDAALRVSYVSATWSIASGATSIVAGLGAHSTALMGTGADILADLLSTFVLIWRFRVERSGHHSPHTVERRAQIMAAMCLLAVAITVAVTSGMRLASGEGAHSTAFALAVAAASVAVLPAISLWKYRVAPQVPSRALLTDGHIGIVGATTAACTLLGLAATSTLGWTSADPVAGLAVAVLAAGTSLRTLREVRT